MNSPTPPTAANAGHNPEIVLRAMAEGEADAIADIVATTPLWQRHGVQRGQFLGRLKAGLAHAATIDVAVPRPNVGRQADIAGFIWYVAAGAFQRSGYIMLLGVAAAYRGLGIGRRLMARAEGMLSRDADDIFLLVSDFNQPAQRFYAQLGYRRVGAIPDYVTPGVSELIYYKRLANQKEEQ